MTYIRKSIIQGIDSNGQEIDIKVNSTGKIMTDDTSVNSLSDKFQRTNFNELRTTNRISQMNFKPTWGYQHFTNTNWQPLIAIRKKSTFGPSSRANSTKVKFKNLEIVSSSELEVRLTINSTTSNLTWASPTGWDTTESSVETKISAGTQLTTSVVGYPTLYSFVNTASTRVIDQEKTIV